MNPPPKIFISGTREDLNTCLRTLEKILVSLGWLPVFDRLPNELGRFTRDMQRETIANCDALFYVVGRCYGEEPIDSEPSEDRRSFAQLAYDIARETNKPVFIFICDDEFSYDEHKAESPVLQALQQRHRTALLEGPLSVSRFGSTDELVSAIHKVKHAVETDVASVRQCPALFRQIPYPAFSIGNSPFDGFPVETVFKGRPGDYGAEADLSGALHEHVQFTAYRPKVIRPGKWTKMLVFAHLDDRPAWLDADELAPIEEMQSQAERMLGSQIEAYRRSTDDSRLVVPRDGEITLVPHVRGIEFNPPRREFLWKEGVSVHQETFDLRASAVLDGQMAGGRLTIFLGHLILAEISLSIRVDSSKVAPTHSASLERESDSAKPYRRIFASYSHRDLVIVETMERHARTLGDEYLRDWVELRSGEIWNDRLQEMVRVADVFQLFWSSNSASSKYVESEWQFALGLNRPSFVRPTYWENPMPPPPKPLQHIHFHRLVEAVENPPQPKPQPRFMPSATPAPVPQMQRREDADELAGMEVRNPEWDHRGSFPPSAPCYGSPASASARMARKSSTARKLFIAVLLALAVVLLIILVRSGAHSVP